MRDFKVEEKLQKQLNKLFHKDKVLYVAVMGKVEEIIACVDVNHYKNLRSPLHEFKRVHVRGSFVLLFKYLKAEDKILFYDLDHHDFVYL